MKLTVSLERGDAALGTLDMDLLMELVEKAVEDSMVETIFAQMPTIYGSKGSLELFGTEHHGIRGDDYEASAKATIRWMLRTFVVSARKVPQVPAVDELSQYRSVLWPTWKDKDITVKMAQKLLQAASGRGYKDLRGYVAPEKDDEYLADWDYEVAVVFTGLEAGHRLTIVKSSLMEGSFEPEDDTPSDDVRCRWIRVGSLDFHACIDHTQNETVVRMRAVRDA
jgi:hypothetical protein